MNEAITDLHRQGIAFAHQGRLDDAAACFQHVLRLQPEDADGYNNLANILLFQGKYNLAMTNYRLALQFRPNDAGIYNHLSLALSKNGEGKEAEQCARQAIRLRPNYPEAHNHLGIALGLEDRMNEAEASYMEALRLSPHFVQAQTNLAQLLFSQSRLDEALAWAKSATQLGPQSAEAHSTLGAVYVRLNKLPEALASCLHAQQLNPQLRDAYFNEATVYIKQGALDQALAICQKSFRINPDYVEIEKIVGMVALKENRLEDALEAFSKVLRKKTNDAEAHFNRSVIWLLQGNYEQGWPEYEWRWRRKDLVVRPFAQPLWNGSSLHGKTILLHAEQGLGDVLQFIRYAPLVKERGGIVFFACPRVLVNLLSRCSGIDRIVTKETYAGTCDEHAPLLSLPSIFQTTATSIPASVPYVFADPALVDRWHETFTAYPGAKIGIAWQGSPEHPEDRLRSIPLAQFSPLAKVPGIHWFSLQKGYGSEQLANAPFEVVDLGRILDEKGGDFSDTAAILMNCDMVITADTALAHLAGALGIPVWVALPFAPDFRWLLKREDSPWYPTMRLFRQSHREQWQSVFEEMARSLLPLFFPR